MNKTDSKSVLQSCLNTINQQSNLMKQCLNDSNLLQALKHCSNFLNELRINQISPKQYYELYMAIFDSLDYLCNYLLTSYKAKHEKNHDTPFLSDLYELVQYSGNIVPRLYMMIAIGTTFMSTNNAPKEAIMKDMIEMCRGVQNPIRGLFLRYYLSQRIKDLLPIGSEQEFNETVSFLITNFIEMNKLWVRLQHQGHSSERELRFKERKELKILVGSNLVRLSQIIDDYSDVINAGPDSNDGDSNSAGASAGKSVSYVPEEYYKHHVFPIITEQIIQCKDHLAQSYLIDVIIQIFPDTFHFHTLKDLLNRVILNLNPTLNKSELISTVIDRFINYHEQDHTQNVPVDVSLFSEFWEFYGRLVKLNLPLEEHSLILQSFIKLSLTFEPDNYDNLNHIYKFVTENFESAEMDEKIWLNLLITPIQSFKSVFNLLNLSFFNQFYEKLSNVQYQKHISLEILQKSLESPDLQLQTVDQIDTIFRYLLILVKETNDLNLSKHMGIVKTVKIDDKLVTNEFLVNQSKICKLLHKVQDPNLLDKINNLQYIKKKYLNKNSANIIYTYPTLIEIILHNIKVVGTISLKKGGIFESKIVSQFKNLSIIIDELYQYHQATHSSLILNLYLNCALVSDQLKVPDITSEFFNKCFIVYEENLIMGSSSHSHGLNDPQDSLNTNSVQYQSINAILNKLYFIRNLSSEDYQNLITKVTIYGSKLLKKQDQCRSVLNCSHLFYWTEELKVQEAEKQDQEESDKKQDLEGSETVQEHEESRLYQDEKRVLECLQKSLRVGDSCIDPYLSLKLFIEILNKCLNFNIQGNKLVNAHYLNGLIELVNNNIENLKDNFSTSDIEDDKEKVLFENLKSYYNRTLAFIEEQKHEDKFVDVLAN